MHEHRTPLGLTTPSSSPHDLVGDSPWARQIRRDILTIAAFPTTVLVLGPTGTGKELIARAVHAASPRSAGPFVPIDCAAMTGTLFASHLFGHVRGAFTGASGESLGAFRAAEGGTLFLDELGELEPELQSKLLRVLQQRTVVPVGGIHEIPIDARIIAATNRDLAEEVREHRFREDLYYRLNVAQLRTIPLCQRREDIPALAQRVLCRLQIEYGVEGKSLQPSALALLMTYEWPGNVRQLNNVLERALLFGHGHEISPSDLVLDPAALVYPMPADESLHQLPLPAPSTPSQHKPQPAPAVATGYYPEWRRVATEWLTMDEVERRHLMATLEHTDYNQTAAARLLGMDRNRLRREAIRLLVDLSRSRSGRRGMDAAQTPA